MAVQNSNFNTLITAIDSKAQSLAASTTDPKDLVYLGKTLEALNVTAVVSDVIGQGDTEVARVLAQGNTSVAAVAAQGANYATLAGATFTGDVVMSANLTVNGTQTVINTATMDVTDKNITVAKGAADGAAADGGGITIEGAGVTFNYVDANKHMALNTGLKVEEIKEAVTSDTTTTGVINVDGLAGAIRNFTVNQTANRTINFRGDGSTTLNAAMAIGESMTFAIMMLQGSTAYYLNAYQIDGSAVTVKWQGGSAPTAGTASSVDSYSFTIIKTAASTYTVLASLAAFA
tara:strand:+ start:1472 stop:2341 length:870 start_codon:yes stop_codon:yes gene_type:complete